MHQIELDFFFIDFQKNLKICKNRLQTVWVIVKQCNEQV